MRPTLLISLFCVVSGTVGQDDAWAGSRPKESPVLACEVGPEHLLSWVNKKHKLPKAWEPADLVSLDKSHMMPGREGSLRNEVADAWSQLQQAATEAGFTLRIRSAYRSYRTQKRVFASKRRRYGDSKARRLSAAPGHSQHQLGTTIDVTMPGLHWKISPKLARTAEGEWLATHASTFGFVMSYPRGQEKRTGYSFEPWHYRYVGVEAATEIATKGLLLEEYLERCARCDAALQCGD